MASLESLPTDELIKIRKDLDQLIKEKFDKDLGKRQGQRAKVKIVGQVEIEREIVSVRERRRYIRNTLKEKGTISFDMLFEDMSSRLQIAVTFLALLELLHAGFLKAEQRENLDAIIISKV